MGNLGGFCLLAAIIQVLFLPGLFSPQLQRKRSLDTAKTGKNTTLCSGCHVLVIKSDAGNGTTTIGKKAVLKCIVSGVLWPNVTWYKDGIELKNRNKGRVTIKRLEWGSRLKIKPLEASDGGLYKCEVWSQGSYMASNEAYILVKAPALPTKPLTATTTRDTSSYSENSTLSKSVDLPNEDLTYSGPTSHPGYCVRYTGQTCSKYVNRKKSVYIKAVNQQGAVEKQLEIAFNTISNSKKLSRRCKPYVLPLLCHYLFPYCDDMAKEPKPRPLCYDECDLLRRDICQEEYIVGKKESLEPLLIPDCGSLRANNDSKRGPKCIHLGIPITRNVRRMERKGDQCFNGSGEHYSGNMSVTEKGFACQRWNSTVPHYHFMSPTAYHKLRGGHNFCRNPGGKKPRPWCFTTDPNKRYDYCDIARCEDEMPVIHVVSILYTVIPCLVIAIVFASVVILICWRCDKQIIYQANQTETPPLMPEVVKTITKIKEIKESLRLLRDLGEGEFGKVYHGEISTKSEGRLSGTVVLVVSLRESHEANMREVFLEKAETWSKLSHPNVISILGTCSQGIPTCVLYQYPECGTLHDYLIRHAPIDDHDGDEDESDTLWCYDLLSIAYQVAAGMNYLSSNNFVHGDLATRNCMVGSCCSIKITDLALTRSGYSHDYHRLPSRRPLPVRWMAPEGILSYRFTTETDIWSFGVVVWELFSFGAQPHFGLSNEDVMYQLRECVQLPCPMNCPPAVYSLMKECWDILPPSRPRFSTIYTNICALRCDSTTRPLVT